MFRNTGLRTINISDFETFYANSWNDFETIRSLEFGNLMENDEATFTRAFDAIQTYLPKNIKKTPTMITKILMGVTGNVPAFDTRFNKWYRTEFDGKMGNIFKKLLSLQESYHDCWKADFKALPKATKQTIEIQKNKLGPGHGLRIASK